MTANEAVKIMTYSNIDYPATQTAVDKPQQNTSNRTDWLSLISNKLGLQYAIHTK